MRAIHFWRFLPLIAFGEPIPVLYKAPYAAKSMRDLWANRWNLVAQASLERGIYIPTLKLLEKNPKIEDKQPPRYSFLSVATATMVTFLVSGLQHELCVVHLMPEQPLGTTVAFFLLNGMFCILEAAFQRVTGYGVNWGVGPFWKCLNWFLTLGTLITLSPLMLRPFIHSGLYFEKVPVPDPIIDFCQNWI
ncbi:hypothetical protein BDR26DRAFT_352773 [Obelidium mucronatum]|nr:hypothetical protein BDR26DRAFT_352773 [Obelidium mucronatum]